MRETGPHCPNRNVFLGIGLITVGRDCGGCLTLLVFVSTGMRSVQSDGADRGTEHPPYFTETCVAEVCDRGRSSFERDKLDFGSLYLENPGLGAVRQ